MFPTLADLGDRIVIIGPSNAGKSTLAAAIGKKTGRPVIHLDQLHHLPHTDWQPRPTEDFLALHDEAIAGDLWVMDGNYSRAMPKRLARTTGVIVIATPTRDNFRRYLYRTLWQTDRPGALDGNRDSLKWQMIRYLLFVQPKNIGRYREMLAHLGLPQIDIGSMAELNRLYRAWGLTR